jgi:hypothetical protein
VVVVNLTGGPKRLVFENTTHKPSFVDLERSDGVNKRIIIDPGRRTIEVRELCKYVTLITTAYVKLIAVEEL